MNINQSLTRRAFIRAGLTACAVAALPAFARATAELPARSLAFYNTHTGETLKTLYWEKGFYLVDGLNRINHILRDHRTGDIKEMDTALLDLLHGVSAQLGTNRPFEIISGYRSPKTNLQLYEHTSGVAFKSMHLEGRAVDIRLADRTLKDVRAAAMVLQRGGVGYYPASDFVHMDTGPVRYW